MTELEGEGAAGGGGCCEGGMGAAGGGMGAEGRLQCSAPVRC